MARMRRRIGTGVLLGLGASLARRGPLPAIALIVSGITILAAAIMAVALGSRGDEAPAYAVPLVASTAIAWGGGFLLAFAGSASALRRDRTEGIRELFVARTTSIRGYIVARVGGLSALLAVVVGGGTALTGMLAVLSSVKAGGVPRTMQATAAAVAYGLAFAFVVAPVAFAALGARARVSGYLFLLLILLVPELITSMLEDTAPSELLEVCAIPSALAALRSSIAPGTVDAMRFLRSAVALLAFAGVAFMWIRRDVIRLEREKELPS